MNTDKAYLLGLVIGGGVFRNIENTLTIKLPYHKWGSYISNPKRAGDIAKDILRVVAPMFRAIYELSISYETIESGTWSILCEGDLSLLINDLNHYEIPAEGEMRQNASINKLIIDLVDDNLKLRFIAGLADTIGSMSRSHRRFTDEIQIISFEISGFQFDFVCQICRLLHSVKCYPDQILWNHPNFHAPKDPYYKSWKKGFKIRVKLDQYSQFGKFAFTTKVESSKSNLQLQSSNTDAKPCDQHNINVSTSCVHRDERSFLLPETIRNGHYIHNKHICAVLGCEHAPYSEIKRHLKEIENHINPFPIIVKDTTKNISFIVNENPLFANRKYKVSKIKLNDLWKLFQENNHSVILGKNDYAGYPINEIIQGITYIISASSGNLHGKRHKGKFSIIIQNQLISDPNMNIEFKIPDLLTPLIISNNGFSVLIGAKNPTVYKKLINIDPKNTYKVIIRDIFEEDLQ